jgi:hypothetical protein
MRKPKTADNYNTCARAGTTDAAAMLLSPRVIVNVRCLTTPA